MELKNTVIFIDYDNIFITCEKDYKVDILEKDFINKIKEYCKKENLFITEMIAYGNYDNGKMARDKHQTKLQLSGIQTKHVMNGKDSADIAIVCDVLEKLYLTSKNIDVYLLVSCDKDTIPLINKIKSQGKTVYLITLAINIDWDVLKNYGDKHIWFEEIINIPYEKPVGKPMLDETSFLEELDNTIKKYQNDINFSLFSQSLEKKFNTKRTEITKLKNILIDKREIEIYEYEYNDKKYYDGIKITE